MKFNLKYPLLNPLVHQGFGDNPQFYGDPKYGGIKGHNGLDYFASHGEPVYATHDGVAHFEIDSGGGHGVVILTDEEFEYKDGTCQFKTIYWHLCDSAKETQFTSPLESISKPVLAGDLIGYADNTGASTGDHLHFGLKPVKNGVNIEQDNGYLGAIDPTPYFDDIIEKQKTVIKLATLTISLLQKLIAWKKKQN